MDNTTEVGFCTKCGIVREDKVLQTGQRVPITDCPCTAVAYGHTANCTYTRLCGSPVIDMMADEERDCDCGKIAKNAGVIQG